MRQPLGQFIRDNGWVQPPLQRRHPWLHGGQVLLRVKSYFQQQLQRLQVTGLRLAGLLLRGIHIALGLEQLGQHHQLADVEPLAPTQHRHQLRGRQARHQAEMQPQQLLQSAVRLSQRLGIAAQPDEPHDGCDHDTDLVDHPANIVFAEHERDYSAYVPGYNSFVMRLNRWAPHIALALVLVGASLRLYRLENKNIWWDEGFTVFMARLSPPAMLVASGHDTAPPLYYGLLHAWMALAGDSEFALRLPSALAGILTIAIVLRLVRSLAGTPAALSAGALVALSRVLVWYSQEVRQYSFATLLAVASLALAYALWRGKRWAWLGYVAVTLAGLLSQYPFVGVLITQNLAAAAALLWARVNRKGLAMRWIS